MHSILKYFLFLNILFTVMACGNSSITKKDPIVFDYYQSYPEIDIKLSDIADIKYIKMKGEEQDCMLPGGVLWNDLYVDEGAGKIYFLQKSKIYIYDIAGNLLYILDKQGRGPEEYVIMTKFWIEKETNDIYCYDGMGKSLVLYDTLFNFKKKIPFVTPPLKDIVQINGDTLLVYYQDAEFDSKNKNKYPDLKKRYTNYPPFFCTMSRSMSNVIKPIKYYIERTVRDLIDGPEYLLYPSIIRGLNGVFMTNKCCDTVLFMDNKTLEVIPRFVDITDYKTPECMTIPSFETDKYLFFDTHFAPKLSPNIKKKYFVYDKNTQKIFQIKVRVNEPLNNILGIVNNQCALTSSITTQNSNYGAIFVQPLFLLDNIDNLSDELKEVAATLNENNNPVLILIKLKR